MDFTLSFGTNGTTGMIWTKDSFTSFKLRTQYQCLQVENALLLLLAEITGRVQQLPENTAGEFCEHGR